MSLSYSHDWDGPWKEVLETFFRDFLEFCYPEIAQEINWSKQHEFLNSELKRIMQVAKTGKRIVDKLIKVWRKSGEEAWVLLHLEVQGQKDAVFAERMFIYRYLLFHEYRVPVCGIAMLIDPHANWRPAYYKNSLWGSTIFYDFNVTKILDYEKRRAELESSMNPFATVVLAQLEAIKTVKANEEVRLVSKVQLTRKLFKKGFGHEQIQNLYRFLDWLFFLPKPLMIKYHKKVKQLGGEKVMTYMTTAERIGLEIGLEKGLKKGLKKGMRRGREEGLQEGREEGREEGQKKGHQEGEYALLSRQLERKFKSLPEKYRKRLKEASAELLLRWGEKIFEAKTLDEIFHH